MFSGKSSLRTSKAAAPPAVDQKLKDYLSKYTVSGDNKAKKRKKRIQKPPAHGGVKVVDQDVTGFTDNIATGDGEDDDAELPVVVNVEEADRLRRQVAKAELRRGWEEAETDPVRAVGSGSRGRQRHDSDDDASPPRRGRHDSDDDASPPRRDSTRLKSTQHVASPDSNAPHPRKDQRLRHNSSDDASPPRRSDVAATGGIIISNRVGDDNGSNEAPLHYGGSVGGGTKRSASDKSDDLSPPRKRSSAAPKLMSDGTMSGLISGKEIQAEIQRNRTQNLARIAQMDPSISGRNAKSVFRDKTGREVSEEDLKAARDKERKEKQWETPEWGAGVAQQRAATKAAAEMKAAASQPFARSRDALDADVSFRERERWGDPMAHLARRKVADLQPQPVLGVEQQKRTGFVVPQAVPAHSWVKRNIGAPLNRFGIKPGRHWDGVDRSNGFEREMFAEKNKMASLARDARAWGQEDM